MQDEGIKNRKKKILKWLSNPYNILLIAIIIGAFLIRVYYFSLTTGQPVWWDEGEYLSIAKHWAFDVPFNLNPQRPPLFQFLASIIFSLGLSEDIIKFFLVVIPSVFLVFCVYLLGKEFFNERTGLIAAFFAAVSWTFLFWSARVQPDFFSLSFQILSIFFMWRYWKKPQTIYVILGGMFAALGLYFKISALLVPMILGIFILIKDRLAAFKNKHYYIFALSFLITLAPYFIWAYTSFDDPFAFRAGYSDAIINSTPFAWNTLNHFYSLSGVFLFVLFLGGLILALRLLLFIDVAIKDPKKMVDPGIFIVIAFIVITVFYVFYIRGAPEDRHVFLLVPFIFIIIANFLSFLYNSIKKNYKHLALIGLLIVLLIGAYAQVSQADEIIKGKRETYLPVKAAGLWLKDNVKQNDLVITQSHTQTVYYSEKTVETYSTYKNESNFNTFLSNNTYDDIFLVISLFEPHPDWVQEWYTKNQAQLVPIQAYFADPNSKQTVLVIYKLS